MKTDKIVAQTSHYCPPTNSHHTEQQVQQHNQWNLVEPFFHLIVCCFLLISKLNSPSSWLIFLLSSTSSSFVYSSRMILLNTLKLKSKNCLQSQTQRSTSRGIWQNIFTKDFRVWQTSVICVWSSPFFYWFLALHLQESKSHLICQIFLHWWVIPFYFFYYQTTYCTYKFCFLKSK